MKKLIVSGDSCTDLRFRSSVHPDWDFSYKKWSQHLAESLGMELVNVARSGAGNQYIYHSLLHQVLITPKDEIGLVVAAWSQAMRKDWQRNDAWITSRLDQDGDLLSWVTKTLRHYISFQLLCDKFDLPYFHFQMTDLFESYLDGLEPTEEEVVERLNYKMSYPGNKEKDKEKILNRIAEYDIIIDNFIGWPGLCYNYKNLHKGFNMLEKVCGFTHQLQVENGLIISDKDDHPNEAGHKAIADYLLEGDKFYKEGNTKFVFYNNKGA